MESALPRQINNALREGVVTEVDHGRALCRVRSGEVHTNFIPWLSLAGNVIAWAPPSVGEQVLILCSDGDLANAVAVRGLYSEQFPAPANAADVTVIRFGDGAVVSYDSAAHVLSAELPAGGSMHITADGGLTISGPVTIDGATEITGNVKITGKAEVTEDVVGGGVSLKSHKHSAVQSGGGTSGPPA